MKFRFDYQEQTKDNKTKEQSFIGFLDIEYPNVGNVSKNTVFLLAVDKLTEITKNVENWKLIDGWDDQGDDMYLGDLDYNEALDFLSSNELKGAKNDLNKFENKINRKRAKK